MKRILQLFALVMTLCLALPVAGVSQQLELSKTGGSPALAGFDKDDDGEWIYWDSGENAGNSIGTGAAATFGIAHRWDPADIAPYDEMYITQVRFFPRFQDAVYTVTIWTGPAGDEVYTQEVEEFTNDAWNIVDLDTPFEIDGSETLWYGVFIDTQGGHPAGCDAGPPVAGKGNMMLWQGEWTELTELNPDLTFNWNLGAFVVEEVENGNGEDTYAVIFNVDMEGAVAEGDVAFDPDIHRVFITGTFADWAQPGSDDAYELHPAGNEAKTFQEILYENFSGGEIPEGWLNLDEDGDGNVWEVVGPPGHSPYDGDYAVMSASWDGAPLTPDNWLITPQITNVTDDYVLSFYVKTQDPDWPSEKLDVLVSTTGTDPDDFTSIYSDVMTDDVWEQVVLPLEDFEGEHIYIAFRHWDSTDWFQIVLDAIKIEGTPEDNGNGNGEEMIYTLTLDILEGNHEYKYFLVEDDPSWDLGEWEGDPNRSINVDGDKTVNDIWGFIDDTSIDEIMVAENELLLYPNPAHTNLNVVSDQMIRDIRIYDITGRVVFSQEVMDNTFKVDVSAMRNGLYIMQVNTSNGVRAHKFHVSR